MANIKMNYKIAVQAYYQHVDAGDYLSLYPLFADDIIYQRCEQRIAGMVAFKQFYEKERTISGKHSITEMIAEEKTVVTRGFFTGKNANNDTVSLSFADFFEFNSEGKIAHRLTYLAQGYQSTT